MWLTRLLNVIHAQELLLAVRTPRLVCLVAEVPRLTATLTLMVLVLLVTARLLPMLSETVLKLAAPLCKFLTLVIGVARRLLLVFRATLCGRARPLY